MNPSAKKHEQEPPLAKPRRLAIQDRRRMGECQFHSLEPILFSARMREIPIRDRVEVRFMSPLRSAVPAGPLRNDPPTHASSRYDKLLFLLGTVYKDAGSS
jgi:hypothetical protein